MNIRPGIFFAACVTGLFGATADAQIDAFWNAPASGTWTDAANWSIDPAVPFNGFPNPADRYQVWIQTVGSPYIVSLDFGIEVDGLVLDSADATVNHTAGLLNLNGGTLDLRSGDYLLDGGSLGNMTITSSGGTLTLGEVDHTFNGVTFDNIDLYVSADRRVFASNGMLMNGGTLFLGVGGVGRAELNVYGPSTLGGTGTYFLNFADLNGGDELEFSIGTTIETAAGTPNLIDARDVIRNRGTILIDTPGSTLSLDTETVYNHGTASISVTNGGTFTFGDNNATFRNWGTIHIGAGSQFYVEGLRNSGSITADAGAYLSITTRNGLTSDLGNIDAIGATISYENNLDLAGGSFDLSGGNWIFGNRFTEVSNGTITAVEGGSIAAFGAFFENVILDADMVLRSGQYAQSSGGFEIAPGRTITLLRTEGSSSSDSARLLTTALTGAGEIHFAAESQSAQGYAVLSTDNTPLNIASGITVRTLSSSGSITSNQTDNYGSIQAEAGYTIQNDATTFINHGTLRAISAGVLDLTNLDNRGQIEVNSFGAVYLDGLWNNTGTILLDSGTLRLGGQFDTTQLNGLTFNSGQVRIIGQVDATVGSLLIDGSGAGQRLWVLGGLPDENDEAGLAGTLLTPNGGRLIASDSTVFTGLTLDGRIDVITAHRVRFEGDTTLVNGAEIHFQPGSNTEIRFAEIQSVLGDGALIFDTPNTEAQISLFNSGVLTLGSGVTLRTGTGSGRVYAGSVKNQGTIRAEGTGQILHLVVTLNNTGTIEAINGGTIQLNPTLLTNSGTILLDGGALRVEGDVDILDLPTYTAQSGGWVEVIGDMDLLGQTWDTASSSGGLVIRDGGIVRNGSVDATGGVALVMGPGNAQFFGEFLGELHVLDGASVFLNTTTPLNGQLIRINSQADSTNLIFDSEGPLSGNGEVRFEGASDSGHLYISGSFDSLILGAGMTVRATGGGGTLGLLNRQTQNLGTIRAESSGGTIHINTGGTTGSGINAGLIEAQDGTAIAFHGKWTSAGTIHLHESDLVTTSDYDLTLETGGILRVDWSGSAQPDDEPIIDVNLSLMLGGTLDIITINGYTPEIGDSLFLAEALNTTGAFDELTLNGTQASNLIVVTRDQMTYVYNPFLGDTTLDGFVGAEDLQVTLSNWGETVAPGDWLAGDLNQDGTVGITDLDLVFTHWGDGTPPDLGNVPEPRTLALFVLSGAVLIRRRRHQP